MKSPTVSLNFPLDLTIKLTEDNFFTLCQNNSDLQFELTASGDLIIMPPTGGETSKSNMELSYQVQSWTRQNKLGIAFDSSGVFKLPNGANRSPDVSWIKRERWEALTPEEREKFPPICPDFVIELLSPSDDLKKTQEKLVEYINNGALLGWLIDRKNRRVEIYRPKREVEILENPVSLSGEDVLPGFVLDLTQIF